MQLFDVFDYCWVPCTSIGGYNSPLYCYAPGYWGYLKESARVLKPGGIRISSDYGYFGANDPFCGFDNCGQFEKAIEQPYIRDLTHFIDFHLLTKLAHVQMQFRNINVFEMAYALGSNEIADIAKCMGRYMFIAVKN